MKRHLYRAGFAGLAAALWLMVGPSGWAASRGEENKWTAAIRCFNEQEWGLALTNLSAFTNDFSSSDHFPQAVLYLAQTQYRLASTKELNDSTKQPWSFRDPADLLKSQFKSAGPLADQYLSWMAESEYADGNYLAAADLYARLARDYDTMRAEALYREAECYSQAKDLPSVVQKLGAPDGAFQQLIKTNASGESVAKAFFLLTETELALKDYAAATAAVQQMRPQPPRSDLEWRRQYLLVLTSQESGRPQEALEYSTNLLTAAQGHGLEITHSRMIIAKINLQLGQIQEGISNYEAVLNSDTNVDNQWQALLNIVEVKLLSGQLDDAATQVEQFIGKHPDERGSDRHSLLLGELRLRRHFAGAAASTPGTNLLMAETNFQAVIRNTNSELRGKAWLYLGWCWWAEGKLAESGGAFSNAADLLPKGEDRAEALFKLGDAEYSQKNYTAAISNYNSVIEEGGSFVVVTNNLFEPALYQILRANTEKSPADLAAASDAVARILAWFPDGPLGQPSELLLGRAESLAGRAEEARVRFADFIARWPQSPLRPDVELFIARTYERQFDWTNAINQYANWISAYSNNPSLPVAEFSLAMTQSQARDDSNAFNGFLSFVEKYPTNELAAQAQYWIGTYHFNLRDWVPAEDSFQNAYKAIRGATPALRFEAEMMAGKAAWARQGYGDANVYFSELANNTNFTLEQRLEARFALADLLTVSGSPTNLAPVNKAVEIFGSIAGQATNELAIAATGKMAGCYLLLSAQSPTNYLAASNGYKKVITATNAGLPFASLSFRCQAEFGMARTLEGIAGLSPGRAESKASLTAAIDHCLNVVNGNNRLDGESRDLREVWLCGKEAGQLMEDLGRWDKALPLYESLLADVDLPSERSELEARIAAARQHLPPGDQ